MMDWKADVGEAIRIMRDTAPTLIRDEPALAALTGFLPLLTIALTAVSTVQKAAGGTTADAVIAVAAHLTPGMAAAHQLSPLAPSVPEQREAVNTAAQAAATGAPADTGTAT